MVKNIIFTILFILIGCASVTFGLISCASVNNQDTDAEQIQITRAALSDSQDTRQRSSIVTSILIPELNADKGVQYSMSGKANHLLDIWETLKFTNGVINILQSAQAGNSESLLPLDAIMKKLSDKFSFVFSLILFWKVLLMISSYMVFLVVIPVCALITIIIIWTYRDRKRVPRVVFASILLSLIVIFAIPAAFQLSALMEKQLLSHNINVLVTSIEEKGRAAEAMERNITAARRQGTSMFSFVGSARTLGNNIVEDATNYLVISVFAYCIIPLFFLILIFFLSRYFIKIILHR